MAATFERPGVTGGAVVARAAAGELTHPNGAALAPFAATESAVRSAARRARLRREREAALSSVAQMAPRDAVERLRQRLCDGIDAEIDRLKLEQAQGRAVCGEPFRQVARAIRELAWLPGPDDPRPPAPGAKRDGVRQGGETRGGLAAAIIAAAANADRGW